MKIEKQNELNTLYAEGLARLMLPDSISEWSQFQAWVQSEEYRRARSEYTQQFEQEHGVMILPAQAANEACGVTITDQGERLAVFQGECDWPASVRDLSHSIDWSRTDPYKLTPSYHQRERALARLLGRDRFYQLRREARDNTSRGIETIWMYIRDKVGHFAFDQAVQQVLKQKE